MDEPRKDFRQIESGPKQRAAVKSVVGAYRVVKIADGKWVLCRVVSQHVCEKDAELAAAALAGKNEPNYTTEE